MSARVMVFMDYQNVHFSALEVFHPKGTRRSVGHVDPRRVADTIVVGRQFPSRLVGVRVYRGRPMPTSRPALLRRMIGRRMVGIEIHWSLSSAGRFAIRAGGRRYKRRRRASTSRWRWTSSV
ncbi:hypothetical protein [Tenggerimyces flavus]|uniref:NYN domain-containing protein n=1 Tax=Tenggerimyces flavus TaxID=1708749 RepID=A0ABV7YQJ5_9ACTN|nr:hypothetical protein [Tenggerimyces flavus]MBM7786231.1 hypothetical protein [Tenggerimyces flavus]